MIKKKIQLNYRKSKKNKPNCSTCQFAVYRDIMGMGGEKRGFKNWRCLEIGNFESIKYQIRPNYYCDNHKEKL